MENCKHLAKVSAKQNALVCSVLNPSKWQCNQCGTQESTWVCLYCGHIACGIFSEGHSVSHYQSTKHPLILELGEQYVYCFECQGYILNDTSRGDLLAIRGIISSMSMQISSNGSRLLRSSSNKVEPSDPSADNLLNSRTKEDDVSKQRIVKQRRLFLLSKTFTAWKNHVRSVQPGFTTKITKDPKIAAAKRVNADNRLIKDAETVYPPGVTGLRNLGNTCWMNSVLQVLGSLDDFRDFFLNNQNCRLSVDDRELVDKALLLPPGKAHYSRPKPEPQTDASFSDVRRSSRIRNHSKPVETEIGAGRKLSPQRPNCGLNGGAEKKDGGSKSKKNCVSDAAAMANAQTTASSAESLKDEVYALMKIMWSGRLSLIIPYGFMHAMWNAIPSFRGYRQQDAQEFLCEMLDKLEWEIAEQASNSDNNSRSASVCDQSTEAYQQQQKENDNSSIPPCHIKQQQPNGLKSDINSLVNQLFNGETVSTVKCLNCGHLSTTVEQFTDLSLEFPHRCQAVRLSAMNLATQQCTLHEMLTAFTMKENLGQVYICSNCNTGTRKSNSAVIEGQTADNTKLVDNKPPQYSTAEKQIMIRKLPIILRLHLKRFRWSGRNRREKISIHVKFEETLDMTEYFASGLCDVEQMEKTQYRLSGVIMHHGRGFNSGHYTAYCWNSKGGFWLHCNDANLDLCSIDDVLKSQAYILFYRRADANGNKIFNNNNNFMVSRPYESAAYTTVLPPDALRTQQQRCASPQKTLNITEDNTSKAITNEEYHRQASSCANDNVSGGGDQSPRRSRRLSVCYGSSPSFQDTTSTCTAVVGSGGCNITHEPGSFITLAGPSQSPIATVSMTSMKSRDDYVDTICSSPASSPASATTASPAKPANASEFPATLSTRLDVSTGNATATCEEREIISTPAPTIETAKRRFYTDHDYGISDYRQRARNSGVRVSTRSSAKRRKCE